MKEVSNLTEDFEQDSVAEWHDGDVWMMGCAVDGVEGFFFVEDSCFFDEGVLCFGFGMVWRLVSVLQVSFFCFSCVQDRR